MTQPLPDGTPNDPRLVNAVLETFLQQANVGCIECHQYAATAASGGSKPILDGKLPHEVLLNEKVGEIKAQIIERDGKILMVKDCPKHGHFEDVMSMDRRLLQTS